MIFSRAFTHVSIHCTCSKASIIVLEVFLFEYLILSSFVFSDDAYNGADCDGYCWSQTQDDVDVKVHITKEHKKFTVDYSAGHLKGNDASYILYEWPKQFIQIYGSVQKAER